MTERTLRPILAAALVPLLFLGCEESGSGNGGGTWNEPPKPTTTTRPATVTATTRPASKATVTTTTRPASKTTPAQASTPSSSPSPAADSADVGADQVPFGSLSWTFGGKPNGRGARNGGVIISGARFSAGGVSFSYAKDLSAWGCSPGELGGIACLFVRKSNGQWVGGKFDWISSSRRSRDFANVYGGYEGWSLAGVPNPCAAAFVIVSPDGKRRSNVITGTWNHR
jgi:hypothetical protein